MLHGSSLMCHPVLVNKSPCWLQRKCRMCELTQQLWVTGKASTLTLVQKSIAACFSLFGFFLHKLTEHHCPLSHCNRKLTAKPSVQTGSVLEFSCLYSQICVHVLIIGKHRVSLLEELPNVYLSGAQRTVGLWISTLDGLIPLHLRNIVLVASNSIW